MNASSRVWIDEPVQISGYGIKYLSPRREPRAHDQRVRDTDARARLHRSTQLPILAIDRTDPVPSGFRMRHCQLRQFRLQANPGGMPPLAATGPVVLRTRTLS